MNDACICKLTASCLLDAEASYTAYLIQHRRNAGQARYLQVIAEGTPP